jgi:hypothetical protein
VILRGVGVLGVSCHEFGKNVRSGIIIEIIFSTFIEPIESVANEDVIVIS